MLGAIVSEHDPFTEERYDQFYRCMPSRARTVLDIGCNTGRGGEALKRNKRELSIFGLDVVKARIDSLPKSAYDGGIHGPSTEIPVDDCCYDVVVAGEVIEHLYPQDVDRSLSEIFRVLKVGGRLILTTPHPSDIKRRVRGGSVLGGPHVSQHHPEALTVKLRMIGFSRVRLRGSGKASRYVGSRLPLLVYGSYLAMADKV